VLINLDLSQVHGNLRILFQNYNVSSYKFKKLYKRKHYKIIIDWLASIIYRDSTKRIYNEVVPALEGMTERDFLILCNLYKTGKLDAFLVLVRKAATEA
jgi:hypothetical protein